MLNRPRRWVQDSAPTTDGCVSHQTTGIATDLHDEPHVEGRRITVRLVHERVEEGDLSPSAFAARYDLDIADVYRALAYYHDNSEEMAAAERRRSETVAAHRADAVTGPEDASEGSGS